MQTRRLAALLLGVGSKRRMAMSPTRPPTRAAPTRSPRENSVWVARRAALTVKRKVSAPNGGRQRRSMSTTGVMKMTLVISTEATR